MTYVMGALGLYVWNWDDQPIHSLFCFGLFGDAIDSRYPGGFSEWWLLAMKQHLLSLIAIYCKIKQKFNEE